MLALIKSPMLVYMKMKLYLMALGFVTLNFCVLFLTMSGFSKLSFAQTDNKDPHAQTIIFQEIPKISIGNESYTRGQISADLLAAGFANELWIENVSTNNENIGKAIDGFLETSSQLKSGNDLKPAVLFKDLETAAPWFYPYISTLDYRPDPLKLHKWKKKITIGIGWPNRKKEPSVNYASYNNARIEVYGPQIEAILQEFIPSVSQAISRDIEYVPLGDPQDSSADYARIRIVPEEQFPINRNWFGELGVRPSVYDYEPYLWSAIPMAGGKIRIRDGYLIPDSNNNLDFVVCKISMQLPKEELKVQIQQCVVRAMGLANYTLTKESSLSRGNTSRLINDYDLKLLHILYCKDIKSGMSKIDVLKVFTETQQCI
jgi:hypothetical protein